MTQTTYAPTRFAALDDIVDSATIAEMAGVGRSAVSQWKDRYASFPDPLPIPGVINPLYSRRAVLAWLNDHRPTTKD